MINTGTLGTNSPLTFSNTLGHGYGTVDLDGLNVTIANLAGSGGYITNSSATPLTLTIGISNVTAVAGNGSGLFGGSICPSLTGVISLIKAGTGNLTLSGKSTFSSLTIGLTNNASPMTNGSLVVSGGSLIVGNGAGDSIAVAGGTYNGTSLGTLDASGASNFTANVGTILVGANASSAATATTSSGTLLLGTNNLITASASVIVGDSAASQNPSTLQSIATAAGGTTTLSTPLLVVGARRCNASFTLGSGATLNLGNAGSRTTMAVGHAAIAGTVVSSVVYAGTADFSGGILKAYLNNLIIGTRNTTVVSGAQTGTLVIGASAANHLDVTGAGNVVLVGTNLTTTIATATGVLTVSNLDATSTITSTDNQTAVLLGAGGKSTGILNLYGGTLTITTTGAAIAGGGGTNFLNLNGVTLRAGASTSSFITNLTAATIGSLGVTFDTAGNNVTVAQTMSGAGGITKTNLGTLILSRTNGYAGKTAILAGTLALAGQGAIGGSTSIVISNGATLDASGRSDQTLTVNNGQMLTGGGNITGNLNAIAGSTISPGNGIGTLTVSSNATLGGTLLIELELNHTNLPVCDQIVSTGGTITGGGTLTATNLGPALQLGNRFHFFNSGVSGFGTVNLPPLTNNLAWANQIAVDGSIKVVPAVSTVPTNITMQVSQHSVSLSWPADHIGWRLQSQTNSIAGTNWLDVFGSDQTNLYYFIIDPTTPGVYFRLIYQ